MRLDAEYYMSLLLFIFWRGKPRDMTEIFPLTSFHKGVL